MIPIQELLNRIRWDEKYGKGHFTLGYYDRIEDRIITVSIADVIFQKGDHFSFYVTSEEGETLSIPFHRVRMVCRDGQVIWDRRSPEK